VFESDFESTDEEEEAGGDEGQDSIAERYIQEEAREVRKVCISKNSSAYLTMVLNYYA
jgi:hypothetical protein